MREFFKGWRRKVGCVALVMAVVVFCAWMRSMIVTDSLWINTGTTLHQLHSCRASLWWESRPDEKAPRWYWKSYRTQNWENIGTRLFIVEDYGPHRCVRIAYWPFAVTLTLLSACLILWKPRPKPKNAVAELSRDGA